MSTKSKKQKPSELLEEIKDNVLSIEPLKEYRHSYIKQDNPLFTVEFHRKSITTSAVQNKYSFEIVDNPENTSIVEIICTDGRRKKNIIQILSQTSGRFAGPYMVCGCEEFVTEQASFCKHLAILNLIIEKPAFYRDTENLHQWKDLLNNKLFLIPLRMKLTEKHIEVYDSLEEKTISFGDKDLYPEAFKSVSQLTYERLQASGTSSGRIGKPIVQVDQEKLNGLLNGIDLYDYQRTILGKIIERQRAICSMAVGTGKTCTSIGAIEYLRRYSKDDLSVLVIAPKSLKLQWEREINRMTTEFNTMFLEKPEGFKIFGNIKNKARIGITTYQYATRHIEKFCELEYDVIIIDEMQFVKNSETKTWQAIEQLRSDYFFGLSGTIIENRLSDLYSVMQIIEPGLLGSKWKFDAMYQNVKSVGKNEIIYSGYRNIDLLKQRLANRVFGYENESIPPYTKVVNLVKMASDQQSRHDWYVNQAAALSSKIKDGNPSWKDRMMLQGLMLKARQSANTLELITKEQYNKPSEKIKGLVDVIEEVCINQDQKIVVFSEWVEMLKIVERESKARFPGLECVFYTGKDSAKQRQAALEKFQQNKDCKIFFSSDAGGVGLDGLQLVCCNVLHTELPWNPARLDQRNGRVHRTLQKNPVTIYYVVSEGSIEMRIQQAIEEKREIRMTTLADFNLNQK